jgi:hypothetical protein
VKAVLERGVKGFDGLDEGLGFGLEALLLKGDPAQIGPAVPVDFVVCK